MEENVLETIQYSLKRDYNPVTAMFDYSLQAHLPANDQVITIKLDRSTGQKLAKVWSQNEYGTFLGQHAMEWIITHLTSGE